MNHSVIIEKFDGYDTTVASCMASAGADSLLEGSRPVMLKPNLVNASPHPVTTPPQLCEAVIKYIKSRTDSPIVIAEGCGDAFLDTHQVFERLGYTALSKQWDIALLDLNSAPVVRLTDDACRIFPEMWLPEAVFEHTLISLPVLKAHSLCRYTGSMKNMMGMAPPQHYGGQHGNWKKAAFHQHLDDAIVDLNRYRKPDFTLMDATIGLADYHLGGACCQPPVNRLLAGLDAQAIDRVGAEMLGLAWQDIGHLH